MGMYDYVNCTCTCPNCGTTVDGFQSKDGDCMLNTMQPWNVDNFYTHCVDCDTWIEFERISESIFTMSTSKMGNGGKLEFVRTYKIEEPLR